jgi:predicted metal-binding membrane protein
LPRRDRAVIAICLVLLTAIAWAYLIRLDRNMTSAMEYEREMAEMGMAMDMRWALPDVLYAFVMWSVMMIGMMTPSAAPVVMLFAGMQRGGPAQRATRITVFASAYLVVWITFSAVAALAQWGLHETAMLSMAMTTTSARVGGAILIAAGIYQLTPFKGACLTHCRSPLGFLMSHWRDGVAGAIRMGATHGAYCLGCCWALMGVLFVVGVMNLVWVAAIAMLVLLEKVGPGGPWVARATGVILIVAGAVRWFSA